MEARANWPAEAGVVAIETASLPALAGDLPTDFGRITPTVEGPFPDAGAVESEGADAAPSQPIGEDPVNGEPDRPVALLTAESEPGVPFVSESERRVESASVEPELKPMPPHPVETVTERPANPRRGWWQRLMQS